MATSNDPINLECNRPQPVTYWLANYYPTNAPGQSADVVGTVFDTEAGATEYARNKLAAEGVGCVLVVQTVGLMFFPQYEPEAY